MQAPTLVDKGKYYRDDDWLCLINNKWWIISECKVNTKNTALIPSNQNCARLALPEFFPSRLEVLQHLTGQRKPKMISLSGGMPVLF